MVLDGLRRRSYLAGLTATVTGLAGCGTGGDDGTAGAPGSETTQPETAAANDPSESTTQDGVPEHDHAGADAGGATLSPEHVTADRLTAARVNGDVYAAAMPGDDLAEKVRNAIDAVGTGGAVVVTPREDGQPWTWGRTVTINLRDTGGVSLLVRGQTMIEYPGDGWALETTYRPADYGQLVEGAFLRLRGGMWRATGNPDGWLRLVDTNFSEIHPELVIDFKNDDATASGIRVENREFFCESNVFGGHIDQTDVGIEFVPAAVTGGGGTNSFEGNYIRNLKVLNASRHGFRWHEDAQFSYCTVQNPDAFAGTYNAADEVSLYDLAGDFDGTVFVGPKVEDAGVSVDDENDANDVGYRLRDAMGTPPLLINPEDGNGVDSLVERADRFKRLPALNVAEDGRAGVYDFGRRDDAARFRDGGVAFPSAELFGAGSLEPSLDGLVVYHDGEGVDVPAGLYRADADGSRWVKVEDNSISFGD